MERFLKQPIINKTENILNKYLVEFKNGFRFILAKDDLTIQDTHVIVNAANNDLWLGGGVAGAIRKKGGEEISRECQSYVKKYGSLKNGQVVPTGIGKFTNKNLKYIFHAVGPIYRDGDRNEATDLKNAFKNCFLHCEKLNLESMSLPPISSGIFGYPKEECASIFYETLEEFLLNKINDESGLILKEVRMTIIDIETYSVFVKVHTEIVKNFMQKFKDEIIKLHPEQDQISNENKLSSDSDNEKNHDQEKIIPSDENKPIQEITESQEVGQKMDHINLENENN
jgi:O-acetyl-ADP-ribose deacetylase